MSPQADEKQVAPSPGPWEVQEVLDARDFDEECANVLLIHGPGGDIAYAAHYSSNGSTAKQQANARLIAAAPKLLEALKSVVRVADRATDEFDAARAAIAKAEGASRDQ